MRISTTQIYNLGSSSIMNSQSSLYQLQNQLSTGKKFLTAKDDPVAAAQVLLAQQSLSVTSQYSDTQATASDQLALQDDSLQSVIDSIQYIKERVIEGGNGTYSDSQREDIAEDLQAQFDFLFGVANSKDASGYYMYSGYQGNTKPFQQLANGTVQYVGDDGERLVQIGSSRLLSVSNSGSEIFQNIRTGNGTFSTGATSSNTGSGVIGSGNVTDYQSWTGDDYSLTFTSATTYTITDNTTSTTLGTYTYSAGSDITDIPGVSFTITGTPASGDTFSVEPSSNQSVFTTLQNLITALKTDISGNTTAAASVRNTLNAEMDNLDQVLQNVSSVQASIGSRMTELASLQSVSDAVTLQYETRISNLQDIDYADAISQYSNVNLQLQAAQSAFAKVSGLSLFNYL